MEIRLELPGDEVAIRHVTDAAFAGVEHSEQTEAKIVEALRAAGALAVSLVAIEGGEVIGHAAFSPVTIGESPGEWFGLGPVSVTPDRQRKSVGQALVREGLRRLQSLGAAGCVVLGDPAYYGRFGFKADPRVTWRDVPPGYLQVLVFAGSPVGEVTYHAGFDAR